MVQTGDSEEVPPGHWHQVADTLALSEEQVSEMSAALELFQVRLGHCMQAWG